MAADADFPKQVAEIASAFGAGGVLGAAIRYLFGRRRDVAEAARAEAEARRADVEAQRAAPNPEAELHERTLAMLRALIEAQNERISELKKATSEMNAEIQHMAIEIESLRDHIDDLSDELRKHKLPTPPRRARADRRAAVLAAAKHSIPSAAGAHANQD